MRPRPGTLSIRRWLALALAVTFLIPALATVTVAGLQFGNTWRGGGQAAMLLRDGKARWADPRWQASTRAALAAQGVDFVLYRNGHELFRSRQDPLSVVGQQRTVQQLVIAGRKPRETAEIYSSPGWWGGTGGQFWLVPLVGLTALLLTLSAIAWLLGRTLVGPLAATGGAARQIAAGDLAVALPGSRVREVDDLNAAFMGMSAELRASLRHQAGLEEERRMFIAAIAHDLRTPLFSLRGHLEGLEQGLAATPQKAAQYVRVCREKADVLERLISDLFAYTRVEYLDQTLRRRPVNMDALLRRTAEGRRREAAARGVTLVLDIPEDARMPEGDEHLLERAVENLLDNALRHTLEGGTIEIRWRGGNGRGTLIVADTGPGIASHDLPHLFEPMYRADPSRSPETGGAGLGLAISRRILRAHGGDLTAANRPSGGAQFTGTLPVARRAEETKPPALSLR